MRLRLAAALVASATLVTALGPVVPARAAAVPAPPAYTDLDSSSTVGHVTGTVLTDQPYAWVRLASNVPAVRIDVVDGRGRFDLETWGYGNGRDPVRVEGVACATATYSSSTCSAEGRSAGFTPTDVTPQVTWPADTTVGPGQVPSVTVDDAGGGDLQAVFVNAEGDNVATTLAHHGTTPLDLDDGSGYVWVRRCATAHEFNCSDAQFSAPVRQDFVVRRTMRATSESTAPLTYAEPEGAIPVATGHQGTFTATWWLADPDDPRVRRSAPVVVSGTLGADGRARLPIDGDDHAALTPGSYPVRGTITVEDPSFGRYPDVPFGDSGVLLDTAAPVVDGTIQGPDPIYPRIGTAKRPATSTVTFTGTKLGEFRSAVVRDGAGTAVARPRIRLGSGDRSVTVVWGGRRTDGRIVPDGRYSVVLVDARRVEHDYFAAPVKVSNARLLTRTLERTVLAAPSVTTRFVGRCSTLRRPSSRGWDGSLGLYSGTRCSYRSDDAAVVSTTHRLVLPRADAYRIRVSAYGGAARARPASRAGLRYRTAAGWTRSTPLPTGVGWHAGARRGDAGLVRRDGLFRWNVATRGGDRYDLGRFRVVVSYDVLVP